MRRIKGAQASPALLVAVVALVAALAGTALAGVAVTSLSKKDKKQVTKIAKKQANIQIGKKAPGLSVTSAKTADSATTADSAGTANGIKPVKVSFAAAADSGETVLLNQGGIRILGGCNVAGVTSVEYGSTANDGALFVSSVLNGTLVTTAVPSFINGDFRKIDNSLASIAQSTVTYYGADGTTVTGELVQTKGVGGAQCRIGGTLFVG